MLDTRSGSPEPFRCGWYARDPGSAVRLALSESHGPISGGVRAAVINEIDRLHLYPDSDTEPLRGRIARAWGVDPEQIVVTNGSDEALLLTVLAATTPGDRCVATERTFGGYDAVFTVARLHRTMTRVTTNGIDVERFREALPGAGLAILCNPHNPTGACLPGSVVAGIAASAAASGTLLVVDEAYAEFADPQMFRTACEVAAGHDVVVLRTFSKAYGISGLRCGYAIASPGIATRISALRVALPYNVNRLALAGAAAALDDQGWLAESVSNARTVRIRIAEVLGAHGIRCLPSQTNFVLAEFGDRCAAVVDRLFHDFNIIIRDARALGFPGWARIGVCVPDAADEMLNAILAVSRS
jgi:histidinol-phosphate aminotransferase